MSREMNFANFASIRGLFFRVSPHATRTRVFITSAATSSTFFFKIWLKRLLPAERERGKY